MAIERIGSILVMILLALVVGCGGGEDGDGHGAPPIPSRADPAFGTIGNVLISDRRVTVDSSIDQVWVGFSREEAWKGLMTLAARLGTDGTPFVGGRLIADKDHHLGFYFDPATTEAGEVV
ncbi:MAG: hypothetical protein ACREQL_05390, partial [Candidatus Binatia bacterium]